MSMPSGITLDGGCQQNSDGTWTVACVFTHITSQGEAEMLSAWLERIVSVRLHEVADVMSVEVPTRLQ